MQIIILKNKDKTQSFEPEWFAKVKIGEEWKDIGTGKTAVSKQDTNYIDLDIDTEVLVDKLRDIDWKPLGVKSAQFVSQLEDKRQAERYPEHYQEVENMTSQEVEDLFNGI